MTAGWIVAPSGPVSGEVRVPGDKSIGHRALLFGALTDGPCAVTGLSGGEDNRSTAEALRRLGVRIETGVVHGVGLHGLQASQGALDCGNSGTSMRLFAGLLAGQKFTSTLIGDESLSRRPMRRVAEPLERMGARITGRAGSRPGELLPPLVIAGGPLRGITYASPVASAQVKSAVILAALYAKGPTEVREPGPSRDHTERMLASLGAPVRVTAPGVVRIEPDGWDGRLGARAFHVRGDPSSAAFLLGAALVAGGEVTVTGVCVNDTRTGFVEALRQMGASLVERNRRDVAGEPVADLCAHGDGKLRGVTLSGELVVRAIDEIPLLAAVAALAEGTTEVKDAHELRVKESDRVATTVRMLRAFGVDAEERPDGLIVRGGARPRGAVVESAGDHRIAMAAAVLALAAEGETRIDDVANVATSFPSFVDRMRDVGAKLG